MGSTGAFLETGGFKWQGWEDTGEKLCGLKILKKTTSHPIVGIVVAIIIEDPGSNRDMSEFGEDAEHVEYDERYD